MARFFEQHDVLICPTAMTPPIPVEQRYLEQLNDVRFEGYLGWLLPTCAISVTGCPVLAVPCGFTGDGLPVGLQVIGAPRTEALLLQVGAWLEQVLDVGPLAPIDPR
jgi:amidase